LIVILAIVLRSTLGVFMALMSEFTANVKKVVSEQR
jgi:hypothetical protein